jgi:hypothetical protein
MISNQVVPMVPFSDPLIPKNVKSVSLSIREQPCLFQLIDQAQGKRPF